MGGPGRQVDDMSSGMVEECRSPQGIGYCWIGGARYACPLNPTEEKKWQTITGLGIEAFVIGFSEGFWPRRFRQYALFCLLPRLPGSLLRYATLAAVGTIIALGLVLRGKACVLIAQSPYEGAIGALVKQIGQVSGRRVALIVESHGDFENALFSYRRVPLAGVYRAVMRHVARYALRHADVLRAISGSTREQLERQAPGKPLVVFPTWTDTSAFVNVKRSVPLSNSHELVFAGALIPLKGVHFLLDALAQVIPQVPDVHLWIAGQASNASYREQIGQQIARLGLERHVTFVGRIGQAELARLMAQARALVLPSTSEGLGRVAIEAMMCGTPVIGSRVGGIPDLIEHGVNGYLVPPADVDALADALRQVLTDTHVERMGQQARALAEDFFSPQRYGNGYCNLFEHAWRALHCGR